jgi:hypothetical protein
MFVGLKRKETCGIKDLNTFNLSLLVKWRWRLLVDKEAQWIGVLRAKYMEHYKKYDFLQRLFSLKVVGKTTSFATTCNNY